MATGKFRITNHGVTLQWCSHKIILCWDMLILFTFHLEVAVGLLCTQKERMARQKERKPQRQLKSSLPWAKHIEDKSIFINQKYSWTFCTAFNQMNLSFDKSLSDQGKRLQLTHRSQWTEISWREFLEWYFCQT